MGEKRHKRKDELRVVLELEVVDKEGVRDNGNERVGVVSDLVENFARFDEQVPKRRLLCGALDLLESVLEFLGVLEGVVFSPEQNCLGDFVEGELLFADKLDHRIGDIQHELSFVRQLSWRQLQRTSS